MAKLSSYYTLCPLIDQQSLLGVEKDADPGCAIVTLGRNIVIRYKLQDFKQESSWSSKLRLSTQVTYDKNTCQYTAVFNEIYIKVWNREETDLDKVKRYKFSSPFHAILSLDNHSPVLVRQDGATASLDWALQNRKSWTTQGFLKPDEKLLQCQLVNVNDRTYLCALTKMEQSHNYLFVGLRTESCLEDPDHATRIELKRTSEHLVGHVILQDKNNAYLLTLWSHGRLYSYPLIGSCSTPVPGVLISVITALNTKHPIVMVALNESTIAAYGNDVNEEGAVLLIYNVQFKLVQAIQKLKLYTKDAKLWRIEDKLLLAANRHLAIAPYRLSSHRIEAMLGSSLRFKINDTANEDSEVVVIQESTVAHWQDEVTSPSKISMRGVPKTISKQISALLNEGASDAAIYQTLIPQLIESKDIATISWCFDHFSDLPEKLLIDLLSFCLRTPDKTFIPLQNGHAKGKFESIQYSRSGFLDRIFSSSFADDSLLPYLKSELNTNETLRLMKHLIEKFKGSEDVAEDNSTEPNTRQIVAWANLLLDSQYQNCLLSQDSDVQDILEELKTILDRHFQHLRDVNLLEPLLNRISSGKPLSLASDGFNKFYSIEEVQLY